MPEKIRLLDEARNTKTIIYRTAGNAISNDFGAVTIVSDNA